MALGQYENVYTVEQLDRNVEELAIALTDPNTGVFIQYRLDELKRQLDILKKKEEKIFSNFGNAYGGEVTNIEQLNIRLKQYKDITVNLSGPQLFQTFLFQIRNENEASFKLFNEAAREAMEELVKENIDNTKGPWWKKMHSAIMTALSDSTARFSSIKGWNKEATSWEDVEAGLFTEEQRERLKQIMKNNPLIRNKPAVKRYLDEANTIQTSSKKRIATFKWTGVTQHMSPKEANDFFLGENGKGEKALGRVNAVITRHILDQVDRKFQPLMKKVIQSILGQSPLEFFIGNNENGIIGILGEIQSLFYLCLLTGKEPSEALHWKGGLVDKEKGAKPHQDLVLKGLGIQVKNTTKDIENGMKVGFLERELSSFLDLLDLSTDVKNIFENYYGMYIFNIPYVYNPQEKSQSRYKQADHADPKAPHGKWYNSVRARLESLQHQIDALMSLFTATIMYMDITENVKDLSNDANVLYLLGGISAVTASSIIENTLAQFENITGLAQLGSFSGNLTTQAVIKKSGSQTIVDAANQNDRVPNYNLEVLKGIVLRSSYVFNLKIPSSS